jgi:hypothetical protein
LRPGNVHSAEGWEGLLLSEIDRQQKQDRQVVFRADAASAKPEIHEALGERGVKYAIRSARQLSPKPAVRYESFLYQAETWKKARRVVVKVEFRGALWAGELSPRVGFIVTNLETDRRAVVRFYNQRGSAEPSI